MSSNVIFLGAGASKDASYPLTEKLFHELEKFCKRCANNNIKNSWDKFNEFRENSNGVLGLILKSNNPELVLTLPDLFQATLSNHDADLFNKYIDAPQNERPQIINQLNRPDRDQLVNAEGARDNLLRVLEDYFLMKHCDNAKNELPNYLSSMLKNVDYVITTNWDTLAERILMQQDKWFPGDGYGFNVQFEERNEKRSISGIKKYKKIVKFKKSTVKVLKLHGSIGWHQRQNLDNHLYLRFDSFLKHLKPRTINSDYYDINSPQPGSGPHNDPILVYPSYFKILKHPILLSIWQQAYAALQKAKQITFVGYSLPEADAAIRALLNTPNVSKIKKTILCPNDNLAQERWRQFFSNNNVTFARDTAEFFFNH